MISTVSIAILPQVLSQGFNFILIMTVLTALWLPSALCSGVIPSTSGLSFVLPFDSCIALHAESNLSNVRKYAGQRYRKEWTNMDKHWQFTASTWETLLETFLEQ